MSKQTLSIENIGKHYHGLFASFTQSIMEYDKKIDAIYDLERSFAPNKEDYYITMAKARVNAPERVKEVARAMIDRMVWLSQDMFAPDGASLKIDKSEVSEACGYSEYDRRGKEIDWTEFNPSKVWNYLVENYAGDKGEEEGNRQTAKAIADSFNLKPGAPIRIVSGKTVLERSIYIDSFDKKWSKKNKISYNCAEGISKSIVALRGFAAWANLADLSESLAYAHHALGGYRSEITSRAAYGGNGIRIITYLNRYEYQLDPSVAEQLMLFLTLYAFPEMQEAA